jgi:hypothetical protein
VDVTVHSVAGLDTIQDALRGTLPGPEPKLILLVLNEEAIDQAGRVVALGYCEVNGFARIQWRANPILEGVNALLGGYAGLNERMSD